MVNVKVVNHHQHSTLTEYEPKRSIIKVVWLIQLKNLGLVLLTPVSVLVPEKPIGGTLENRMYQRILTKIGGDRETVCITKDQPAIAMEIIIYEVIADSVRLPNPK